MRRDDYIDCVDDADRWSAMNSDQEEEVAVIHHLEAIAKRGGVPTTSYLELLEECEELIRRARADMGYDVGGFGIYNLLCDNTEENGDVLELVMKDLGEVPPPLEPR